MVAAAAGAIVAGADGWRTAVLALAAAGAVAATRIRFAAYVAAAVLAIAAAVIWSGVSIGGAR